VIHNSLLLGQRKKIGRADKRGVGFCVELSVSGGDQLRGRRRRRGDASGV
jgi:hypothetical protein